MLPGLPACPEPHRVVRITYRGVHALVLQELMHTVRSRTSHQVRHDLHAYSGGTEVSQRWHDVPTLTKAGQVWKLLWHNYEPPNVGVGENGMRARVDLRGHDEAHAQEHLLWRHVYLGAALAAQQARHAHQRYADLWGRAAQLRCADGSINNQMISPLECYSYEWSCVKQFQCQAPAG